jgi:hypothetical protein
VCARLFSNAARPPPQAGQIKPSGQRRSNKNAAQLVSSEKLAWNSLRERALATAGPLAPAACGGLQGHYTTYGPTWDNGISSFKIVRVIVTSVARDTDIKNRVSLFDLHTACKALEHFPALMTGNFYR